MPRPKPTSEDIEKRRIRAKELVDFRFEYLLTQKKLADILTSVDLAKPGKKRVGVSRRTIQMIEAGSVTPHPHTIRLFEILRSRYRAGKNNA